MSTLSWLFVLSIAGGLVYFSGYTKGEQDAANFYQAQLLEATQAYQARLQDAELKASKISQDFIETSNELSNLNNANQLLIKRMQQLESSAAIASNSTSDQSARHAADKATCPDISSRMAQRITDITRRADQAALYATQCHKWILSIRGQDKAKETAEESLTPP